MTKKGSVVAASEAEEVGKGKGQGRLQTQGETRLRRQGKL